MTTQTLTWNIKDWIKWMNIPKGFKPENKALDDKVDELINSDPFYQGALAIAVEFAHHWGWSTDILVWMPTMEKPEKVARREGCVHAFCVYKNFLYDGGDYNKVIDTLNREVVAERKYNITSLCVHDGVMYDGGHMKVFKTDEGKIVAKREGWVKALCSFNGELYDAGSYQKIMRTFDNTIIRERKRWIYALGCHDDVLYDTDEIWIRNTFENKRITRRKEITYELFSFNGKLCDAGQYNFIYETSRFFKRKLLKTNFKQKYGQNYRGITAVQPISFWLANQLLSKA